MDMDRLQELIRVFEASELSELEIEEDGRRMRFKKSRPKTIAPAHIPVAIPASTMEHSPRVVVHEPETKTSEAAPKPEKVDEGLVTINSPMVGVFYAASAPGEAPFVKPGDMVDENQTVCIVEAMKLMNEVAAKMPAVIEKVLVENGEPVEFGQPLFLVRPIEQV